MNPAANTELELIADIAKLERDPLGFVEFAFPWGSRDLPKPGPRKWQRALLDKIGKALRAGASAAVVIQEAIASGHGIGKSALISWLIIWGLSTVEDARALITANTEAQLANKTWPELKKWHRLAINGHWFEYSATSLHARGEHEKTWRADALPWTEHRPEAFAGLHNAGKRTLLLFDEASAIPDVIWETVDGALTDADTQILWAAFGNPTRATGRFRECFRKFRHRWGNAHIDSRTVEDVNLEQTSKWVEDYGEDSDFVKMRVRGIFPSASPKQFISEADIDAAYGRHLPEDAYDWAPIIITCDPSWEGDDELVIAKRQGLAFSILEVMAKNDNDILVANKLARYEDELQADAVFVDAGYGTGIVSAGKTMKREWRLVWFGGESADPGCLNKRAEMWREAREWLKAGGVIPADPVLRQDLAGPETVPRADGKIQIESKKDMKARGLPSPNRGDALVISFAYPVLPRDERQARKMRQALSAKHDYDPMVA